MAIRRKAIISAGVPRPIIGSHAVKAGEFVFLGGQIPSDYQNGLAPELRRARGTSNLVVASKLQSEYILQNSQKILKAAGSSLELGIRIDQFCTHPDAASPYLETRIRHISPETRPASTHIQIESFLVPNALCALQLIALTEGGMTKKEIVFIPDMSSTPGGPFKKSPHGSKAGDFVFVTGQNAGDFKQGVASEASVNPAFWYGSSIKLQTAYALKRCETVLKASGSSLKNVVRADIYLTNMEDFYQFEEVWIDFFPDNPPARTFIPVNRFAPKDCIVEINMIALQDNSQIKKETIIASDVPRPDTHQPHAVRAGDFVFLSGMYATDFAGGLAHEARLHPEMPWFGSSAKKQTDYILKNMAGVCRSAGTNLKNLVWTQNFYTDLRDFYPSLEVWQQYFPEDPPASFVGAVKTPQLIPDCTILFDAVAVVTD